MIRPPQPANWVPPAGLLLVGWIIWGMTYGVWWLAVPAGLLSEAYRYMQQRWTFDESDYVKIWNACMIFTLGVLSYNLLTVGLDQTFYLALKWMPALFLPFALSQFYGEQGPIPLLTVAVLGRRRRRLEEATGRDLPPQRYVHLGYPMLALILMSAGARATLLKSYSVILIGIIGIAIWNNRDRLTKRPVLAMFALLLAGGMAVVSGLTIRYYGRLLQSYSSRSNFQHIPPDPSWTHTRIGQIGQLKESHVIQWVLKSNAKTVPRYIREASYLEYGAGNWYNQTLNSFSRIEGGPTWELNTQPGDRTITLTGRTPAEVAILPMPYAVSSVANLQADAIRTNFLGAVQGVELPATIRYEVRHHADKVIDSPATPTDLTLDRFLFSSPRVLGLVDSIWQPEDLPEERLRKIVSFFNRDFYYTMYQPNRGGKGPHPGRALIRFLTESRAGHCEYYATATTMLLRHAGIPARYTVGYHVSEWDGAREAFNLRARHRHAWCQAWINGQWTVIDTTPGTWLQQEQEKQPAWQPLRDTFSRLFVAITLWQASPNGRLVTILAASLLGILLCVFLFVRIILGRRSTSGNESTQQPDWPGQDSEFFAVLAEVDRSSPPDSEDWLESFDEGLRLHQAYRFDPKGLAPKLRNRLRDVSTHCVRQLKEIQIHQKNTVNKEP